MRKLDLLVALEEKHGSDCSVALLARLQPLIDETGVALERIKSLSTNLLQVESHLQGSGDEHAITAGARSGVLGDLSVDRLVEGLLPLRVSWNEKQTRMVLFKVLVQLDDLIDSQFLGAGLLAERFRAENAECIRFLGSRSRGSCQLSVVCCLVESGGCLAWAGADDDFRVILLEVFVRDALHEAHVAFLLRCSHCCRFLRAGDVHVRLPNDVVRATLQNEDCFGAAQDRNRPIRPDLRGEQEKESIFDVELEVERASCQLNIRVLLHMARQVNHSL